MEIVRVAAEHVPAFVDLGFAIGARDPRFVPPMRQVLLAELSGQSAFARYGLMELFAAERGGAIVARAAAIVNPRLTVPGGAPLGQIGYFEAEDDVEAVRALFGACFASLEARGARAVTGPMNGGAHRAHRLMTRGFERDPFLFEPRNPPWYPRLFEENGFARAHTWASHELDAGEIDRVARVLERASRALPQRATMIEPLDPHAPETYARLHELLDRVWAGHVGYAPIDRDELAEVIGGAFALMTPRGIRARRRTSAKTSACRS